MILEIPILYYANNEQVELEDIGVNNVDTTYRMTTIIIAAYSGIMFHSLTATTSALAIDEESYTINLPYNMLKEKIQQAMREETAVRIN